MKALTSNIEILIQQAMSKAGERFETETDLLTYILGNFISEAETKEQRLDRTQDEFDGWIRKRLATPRSEYKPLPSIAELKARYHARHT